MSGHFVSPIPVNLDDMMKAKLLLHRKRKNNIKQTGRKQGLQTCDAWSPSQVCKEYQSISKVMADHLQCDQGLRRSIQLHYTVSTSAYHYWHSRVELNI